MNLELETAKYFIYLSDIDEKNDENIILSNNKLQCLLFLLQNYHYEQHDKLYFEKEVFVMGEFSPMIPSIYKEFQHFGANDLFLTRESDYGRIDRVRKGSIKEIWDYAKGFSTSSILKMLVGNKGIWNYFYKDKSLGDKILNQEFVEFIHNLS